MIRKMAFDGLMVPAGIAAVLIIRTMNTLMSWEMS